MSQYPYGYGGPQWPAHPGGTPAYGYPQPTPGYQGGPPQQVPQDPNAFHGHYATNQAAFDHNMHTTASFGVANPSPAPPGGTYPPAGGWGHPAQYPSFAPNNTPQYQGQSPSLPVQQQQSIPPISSRNEQLKPTVPVEDVTEDGEVSEGEFEDFYEPVNPALPAKEQLVPASTVISAERDEGEVEGSDVELQDDAFYDDEPGEVTEDVTAEKATSLRRNPSRSQSQGLPDATQNRERSGSYSPYLSPREVHHDDEASEEPRHDALHGVSLESSKASPKDNSSKNEPGYSSVQDARKEAQKAILRLYSSGVKYQTYIDEGFDEDLIKSLFAELGLQSGNSNQNQPPGAEVTSSVKDRPPKSQKPVSDGSEERKDRIARLLAAKKSKPAPVVQPASRPSTTTQLPSKHAPATAPAGPSGKTKARTAKEILLQQKLEALHKSREEREARARANAESSGAATPSTSITAPTGNAREEGTSTVPDQTKDTTSTSRTPSDLPGAAEAFLQGISSSATAASMSHRKRPVASDFVDYSTTVGSLKRPYGQQRHESSLVIDISDDGSDDEDIEMEVDSQGDDADDEHSRRLDMSGRKGPTVRDFPPLSDTLPPRQYASSASSMHTPPNGFSNGSNTKAKDDEYARKMREIEDMKRRIAAFEAKKSRKTPTGSQTPTRAVETPDATEEVNKNDGPSAQLISEAVSARLPKRSDNNMSSEESHHERRNRIVSVQLPKLDASLREKVAKLKLLQDRVAQLQAEVDQSMVEKLQLADEAEQLGRELEQVDSTPSEVPSAPAQDSSPLRSAEPSASEHGGELDTAAPTEDIEMSQTDRGDEMQASALDASKDDFAVMPDESQPETTQRDVVISPVANAMVLDVAAKETNGDGAQSSLTDAAHSESSASEPMDEDDQSDAYEPPEPLDTSSTEPERVDLESSQPSPATGGDISEDQTNANTNPPGQTEQLPAQISDVAQTNTEVESELQEAAAREVTQAVNSKTKSSFTPYDSPLKYFRAYRFHPQYKESTSGGLRSLTYNSKIKPEVEICPDELDGKVCARGDACEYQHFKSMVPKDDQILVELGKSDDFSGEQKSRFVQGLREVLQKFRAGKVRDFDTIANGIIEYRRRFLGDNTRVLNHMEGVSL